jgi:hypothetical protein
MRSFQVDRLIEELNEFLDYHGFDGRIERIDDTKVMIVVPEQGEALEW